MTAAALPMPALPKASLYVKWQGKDIRRGTGFVRGERITCPGNHRLTEAARLLGDALLYCDHKSGQGQAPCGWTMYVLVLPSRGGRRRIYAADCTRDEFKEIERLALDPDGVLAYFGEGFTR